MKTDKQASTPYHHGNLEEALVSASLEILAECGIEGLGLRGVARAAGVSQTAPYHHFGCKQGLLAAVAAEGFRRLATQQEAALEAAGLDVGDLGRMRLLAGCYVTFARANPQLYRLMFGGLIVDKERFPVYLDAYQSAYTDVEDEIRGFLACREDTETSVKLAMIGCWSLVHGISNLLNDGVVHPGQGDVPDEPTLVAGVIDMWSRAMLAPG
jgi:AcrR family transcriptional regulator